MGLESSGPSRSILGRAVNKVALSLHRICGVTQATHAATATGGRCKRRAEPSYTTPHPLLCVERRDRP